MKPLPRFAADRTLGKLARMLRMLGQDVEVLLDRTTKTTHDDLEGRILLTRDRARAREIPGAVFIENAYPYHQARQVVRTFGIRDDRAFTRCVEDNGQLRPAETIQPGEVPDAVRKEQRPLFRCDICGKVYWPGSHVDHMRKTILDLVDAPRPPDGHAAELDDQGRLDRLEPLLDVHQALDALFWSHRLALLHGDIEEALRTLRRFAMNMGHHLRLEEELVLPLYERHPHADGFPRGGAPEIFRRDHEKILRALPEFEHRGEAILAQTSSESRDLGRLEWLDAQRKYLDLLAQHDHRERLYLYPRLA
ncbi:MAG: Mut7-C RNAse domain-containing protein, partial [Myxococcota bacterium]